MLYVRLNRLRSRLDALKEGRVLSAGIVDRALALLDRGDPTEPTVVLEALDRELDQVGVHTAADAKLLRALGVKTGRAGRLAQGLKERAREALDEVEERVKRLERAVLADEPARGALTALERAFVKLARAVKVADLFAEAPESEQPTTLEIFARAPSRFDDPPSSARLAIAEFWARRAKDNVADLVQKRRDLDAAHELLLRLGSDVDRERARALRLSVADSRERVRSAPAVRSLEDLSRHVRLEARRDLKTAYRSLRALYERAVEAGDPELARIAHQATSALLPPPERLRPLIEHAEHEALYRWIGPAREATRRLGEASPTVDDELAKLAYDLDDQRLSAFELALGCARFFDVEDALAEEIVEAELFVRRPVQRRVPYPTQTMTYEFTNSLDELPNFVITHPKTLLYDLASNRQIVRAYLDEEPPPKPKRVRRTAVRVYVLDASGSMHGARARFRDAILLAELNNLRVKARAGRAFDPLYFSFFNDSPTDLVRVDTPEEATRQMERLFQKSPAEGQTDITLALVSAFDAIRASAGKDPYLARATVVLVTDGEDGVDLELLRRTRAPLGQVDIALSFISLGEENPDLKSLVLEQRERGGRAFYHHLSDAEINSARTEFDSTWRTLLPRDLPDGPAALDALMPHLEALEAVAQNRPAKLDRTSGEQFDALFPQPPEASTRERSEELDRVVDILEAIAEAASLAPAEQRAEESVTLLNHLLGLYGIAMSRYLDLASRPTDAVRAALERVRLLCRPFG